MPKIIPDLGPRILEVAAKHFETKGYDSTDMKSLAMDLGISVGTLYNYYASKPELFLEVILLWKNQLTSRMMDRLDHPDSPEAKLRAVLMMLYEDMDAYTGIWKEFMRSGAQARGASPLAQRFKEDNSPLLQRLQELFRDVWKDRPHVEALTSDPEGRLARLIVGSIMQLVMSGQSGEASQVFLSQWIDFMVPLPTAV